jgi:hypothetical protein
MFPLWFYYSLLIPCWAYAVFRGAPPEQAGATIMMAGSLLTTFTPTAFDHKAGAVLSGILIFDIAAFIGFVILAVRADRFWPIWVSALAGLGVVGHVARWYGGDLVTPRAYIVGIVIWSYVILALLAIGTRNHQRRVTAK